MKVPDLLHEAPHRDDLRTMSNVRSAGSVDGAADEEVGYCGL